MDAQEPHSEGGDRSLESFISILIRFIVNDKVKGKLFFFFFKPSIIQRGGI